MFSRAQLESQRKDLDRRLENFEADHEHLSTERQKNAAFGVLEADFKTWRENWDRTNSVDPSNSASIQKIAGTSGSLGNNMSDSGSFQLGAKGLGRDVYPFGLPKKEVKAAFEATKRGGGYIIEAKGTDGSGNPFTSIEGQLVPQQAPGIVPEYFEARLIDHLPVTAISAPTYRFLQHNFASDSGGPGFVAEGQTKPQWNPSNTHVDVTAQKIAGFFDESTESRTDYEQWSSYLINTLFQKIMQIENHAILYGTVTDSLGIQGWSTQSGILTHDASADSGSATNLDSLEIAINQMRTQSGVFATPSIAIMSPTTWSATRRIKTTTGQYVAGDPLHEAVTSIWGTPVITTTVASDGDCFLVDVGKMGSILVKEGISTHMGYTGDGLINNILTTVAEERLTLATVIPSAVNYVTNLDVS